MHNVIFDFILFDREESAETHVERELAPAMTLLDLFEQSRRKVETGSGGSRREAVFGINGLIITGVAQKFFDIGRGRHGADLGEGSTQARLFEVEVNGAFDIFYVRDGPG